MGLLGVLTAMGFANVVLVASRDELPVDDLRRAAARQPLPTGVVPPSEVLARGAGAQPFSAASGDTAPSPAPPD